MPANTVSSISEALLQENVHYGPVTAVKFLDTANILIGYGPFLRLLRIDHTTGSAQQVWSQRIFKRNKIHYISVSSDKSAVAVAGGRSFAVVDLQTRTFCEKAINEWIMAVDYSVTSELLILNSHNEVLQAAVSNAGTEFEITQKIHCNEKSILYSGSIQRCSDGNVYVAAGTVMSGVLIWNMRTREIMHNFTDHEGSIFAVKIDQDARYVISCSDDRSIKLYSFQNGKLLASGWGHGSRIWSLSFYDISSTSVKIFSTGEDCSARLWEYKSSSTVLGQLKCFDSCHEGKHVWSGDAESQYWQCLVTGGADGKVRLLDVSAESSDRSTFEVGEIQDQCGVTFEKKEVLKQFVKLPKIQGFVAMTSLGRVFFHTRSHGWTLVEVPEEQATSMRDFAILRSFAPANHVLICTRSGDLLVLGFSASSPQPVHLEIVQNKSEVKVINVLSCSSSDHVLLLLVSPAGKYPLVAKEFTLENDILSCSRTYEVENPDPRAFSPTSVYFDPDLAFLLVGSRHGNFAAYDVLQSPASAYFIRKLCPGDSVTSISKVHSTSTHIIAMVTVRDGIYLMVKLSKKGTSFEHEIIHQNKFTKGFIEGAFYEDGQLYLYGFRSGSFFVWNETQQVEIDHEPCGGAHRQWEFTHQESGNTFGFSFLRNSSLISKEVHNRFGLSANGLLSTGTHGREIRSLALCPGDETDGSKLFASASEDATIKVGYVSRQRQISYKWTMNSHVSGLQAVDFLNDEFFASSAANEELIIWRLNREVPDNIAVSEQARISTADGNPDLRVMDFSSVECDDGFYIAAGFSNSQIKIFFYDRNKRSFSVLAQQSYSTFCILNVEFITTDHRVLLVAGTTDGVVTIWDVSNYVGGKNPQLTSVLPDFGAPIVKQQFHQSGVKALAVVPSGHTWKIITGGDDNSLVSATLSLGSAVSLEIDSFVERAASATITAISPVEHGHVVVTSVDQIVRKWSYTEGLVCSSATYTTVADTGCCVSGHFDRYFAIVGGAGLSVFDL